MTKTQVLDSLTLRQLQLECARASAVLPYSKIANLSSKTHYSSVAYYKMVIQIYVNTYGDLPSKVGPGASVTLLYEDEENA